MEILVVPLSLTRRRDVQ